MTPESSLTQNSVHLIKKWTSGSEVDNFTGELFEIQFVMLGSTVEKNC